MVYFVWQDLLRGLSIAAFTAVSSAVCLSQQLHKQRVTGSLVITIPGNNSELMEAKRFLQYPSCSLLRSLCCVFSCFNSNELPASFFLTS